MMQHQQQPKKSDRRSAAAGAAQQPQQQPPKSSSRSESDSSSSSDDDNDCSMLTIGQRKRTSNTSTNANKRPRNNIPIPRSPLPPLSIAAERALNRARIHHHNHHHHTTATTTTAATLHLTLSQQTHILGAAGRAALLLFQPDDAHHQAIQRMRHHTWPTLLKRALEGINRRARDALEKRLRLAVRGGVATTPAALDLLAAHVDRAVDFTDRHSVQANAALVRDCLNEIRDDADRNLPTPVPWRECLPPSILLHHLDDATTTPTLLLDAHLADWARADAADEAAVRAALAADLVEEEAQAQEEA